MAQSTEYETVVIEGVPVLRYTGTPGCDSVKRPSHYMILNNSGEVMCEVRHVQAHCNADMEGMDAADMANAIKYLIRSPFKGKRLEDLKKSRFMIDEMIKRLEAEQ